MTSIIFPFEGYPTYVKGKPKLVSGKAEITLGQPFSLPVHSAEEKARELAPPLQQPPRWRFSRVTFDKPIDAKTTEDVERWVRGKFWPKIGVLLFARFLAEAGLEDKATLYYRLAA